MMTPLENADYFGKELVARSPAELDRALERGEVKFAVTIPADFSSRVIRGDGAQILVEAANKPPPPGHDLTKREWAVLALLVEGLNNTQIAHRLGVSSSTVKTHVSNILSKFGVESRTEAAALALRHHLIA